VIAYQRGAAAIARQVKREGIELSVEEAKKIIDTFYSEYPNIKVFIERCKREIFDPGYICNAFGRRRHFTIPSQTDDSTVASVGREAVNFPIQSTVADCLSWSLINLYHYRNSSECRGIDYKIIGAIHDAVLLEVKDEHIDFVSKVVLPKCMSELVVIPGINKSLKVDIEVYKRWYDK